MIYFALASCFFFLSLCFDGDKRYLKYVYVISVSLLIAFVGFRFEVGGADWISYKAFYSDIEPVGAAFEVGSFFNSHGFEVGFKFIASVLKSFFESYIALNFLIAFMSLTLVSRFLYIYSPLPLLSLYIYFCSVVMLGDMTVIRQMMAVAIFAFSLEYLRSREFKGFFVAIIIATSFHYSAILMLILYPIYHFFNWNRWYIFIGGVGLALKILFSNLVYLVMSFIGDIPGLSFAIYLKVSQYMDIASSSNVDLGVGALERVIVFFTLFFLRGKLYERYGSMGRLVVFLSLINFLLFILLSDFSEMYLRVRYFFLFSQAVLYAMLIKLFSEVLILRFVLFLYGMLWVYIVVSSNYDLYLPYKTVLLL